MQINRAFHVRLSSDEIHDMVRDFFADYYPEIDYQSFTVVNDEEMIIILDIAKTECV